MSRRLFLESLGYLAMSKSFEAFAAEIKRKARELELAALISSGNSLRPDGQATTEEETLAALTCSNQRAFLVHADAQVFIRQAYRWVLGREADPEGVASYSAQLAGGVPRLLIVGILLASPEARKRRARMPGLSAYRYLAVIKRALGSSGLSGLIDLLARAFSCLHQLRDRGDFLEDRIRYLQVSPKKIREELSARLSALSLRVSALESQLQAREEEFSVVLERLNRSIAPLSEAGRSEPQPTKLQVTPDLSDALSVYYLAFEDAMRGSAEQVSKKYLPYTDDLAKVRREIAARGLLDLGCGRGEWLEFTLGLGFDSKGIDLNPTMLEAARKKGLNVTQGDINSALRAQGDQSLAVISGFHVIEHLPFEALFAAVGEAWRALTPGGILILETPNPENILVATHTFYHDHTHRNPLTPSAMTFLLQYWGFRRVQTKRLNPYPDSSKVPGDDPLTERINGHFCGPQDFAVLGWR